MLTFPTEPGSARTRNSISLWHTNAASICSNLFFPTAVIFWSFHKTTASCLFGKTRTECPNYKLIFLEYRIDQVLHSLPLHSGLRPSSHPHKSYSFMFIVLWWEWEDVFTVIPQELWQEIGFLLLQCCNRNSVTKQVWT